MMDTVKGRLKSFIKSKGLTVNSFEKKCGFSTGFVGNMRVSMKQDKLSIILSEFPELNREWLLYGEGEMLNDKITLHLKNYDGTPKEADHEHTKPEAEQLQIIARIRSYIKYLGITETHFARLADIPQTTLANIFGRKSDIKHSFLIKITNAFEELNPEWLIFGKGNMLRKAQEQPVISYTEGKPYYDIDFLNGYGEFITPFSESPEFLIQMPRFEHATLWCNASGDSMAPEINNGDIIALQKIDDIRFLPLGDIYAIVATNGLRVIKRLGKSEKDGFYKLIPTNPNYDAQDIPIDMLLHVYKVLGCMKRF